MGRKIRRANEDQALVETHAEWKAKLLDKLLEVYADAWEQMRPQVFTPDCCIAAVALGLRVFRHFGFYAQQLPVKATAMNQVWFNQVWQPYIVGEIERLPTESEMDEAGMYSVGLGQPGGVCAATGDSTGWDGHLVMIIERKILVDPSASQMSRPDWAMEIPQTVIVDDLGERFNEVGCLVEQEGAAIIHYRPDRKNTEYLTANDWTKKVQNDHYARLLIAVLDR